MVKKEEINGYFLEAVRRLKAQGYTQKDIVEAAGLSQNAISKIKTGQNNAGDDTINKLCSAFNLNPDFFYKGSSLFTMEEVRINPRQSAPTIDPSTAMNALIAEHVRLVNLLEADIKKKEIEMEERLADKETIIREKDARILSLERTISDKETIIREKDARILSLERQLAAARSSDLQNYPFAIGAAEQKNHPKNSPL